MGKNKKNRQKQQQNVNSTHQIPIITATATFDDSPDPDNLPEQVTVHSPVIFVETPLEEQNGTSEKKDRSHEEVLEEVKRRKAVIEAAVVPKEAADPHKRITFTPFAYALRGENLHLFCWYCLKEYDQVRLRPCTGQCKVAWFCNDKCEKLALKDHRPECNGYKRMDSKSEAPDVEVRLLGRIAHRYKQIRDGEDKKISDFYKDRSSKRSVMDIWDHEEKFASDRHHNIQFEDFYQKLTNFYASDDLPSKEEIFKLHCRDFVNRHAISDVHYQNEVGKGLYLDLCAYDHSCAPDTIFYSVGFKSVLVGLEPRADISNNKKSFYSYVDLIGTFAQRQKQLKDTWFFDCKCVRCNDPYDHVLTALKCHYCFELENLETPVILQGERALKVEGRVCCPCCEKTQESFHVLESNYLMRDIGLFMDQVENGDVNNVEAKFKEFLTKADQLLPCINAYRTRLILGYVNLPDISAIEKVKVFISTEPCLRYCFPRYHPGLGFYLRDVAYFCANAELFEDAAEYATECLDIMERIFVEHEVINSMRQKLADYQRKAAAQKEAGKSKRLQDLFKPMTTSNSLPQIQLLTTEPKISHGSAKDRAHHRRTHRAPTPLPPLSPPELTEEGVQFVTESDI